MSGVAGINSDQVPRIRRVFGHRTAAVLLQILCNAAVAEYKPVKETPCMYSVLCIRGAEGILQHQVHTSAKYILRDSAYLIGLDVPDMNLLFFS